MTVPPMQRIVWPLPVTSRIRAIPHMTLGRLLMRSATSACRQDTGGEGSTCDPLVSVIVYCLAKNDGQDQLC